MVSGKRALRILAVLWIGCWGGWVFLPSCLAEGGSLVGSSAPSWRNRDWINSKPLSLAQLKGKVVLVRFFTGPSCPFCRATASALNRLHAQYGDKGLVVIGMYTPKPVPAHQPLSRIRRLVQEYGFEFPVAVDNDWATLKAFWLNRVSNPAFTSVAFVIDRQGLIRWVHPGGQFSPEGSSVRSRRAYEEVRAMVEKLLSRH